MVLACCFRSTLRSLCMETGAALRFTANRSRRARVVEQSRLAACRSSHLSAQDCVVSTMAYRQTTGGLPSHIRPSSGLATSTNLTGSSNTQSSALQARITEKRAELESLKQLRDLSAGLAGQMQQLEEKLSTLSNGTEAVAEVLSNWNAVLRAVYMASSMLLTPRCTRWPRD